MTSLTSDVARNRQLTVVGVVGFAAMMAVGAQIAIPIPGTPVPFTLQPLAVVLAGLCLGPVAGAASMALYLLIGALGAPVFSPIGAPGVLRLIGPTGGYLLAAPAAAAIAGLVARRFPAFAGRMLAAFLGIATLYLGGVAQLELLTGSLARAAAMGTVPFVLADLGKVVVAAAISSTRTSRSLT
jgi:biotin transport system substrate-specific component